MSRAVVSTNQFRSPRGTVTTSTATVPVLILTAGRAAFEDSGVVGAYLSLASGRAEVVDAVPTTPATAALVSGRVLVFG